MQEITVGNIKIDVVRKDIKNLHLAVYPPTGRVRIATPLHIDDETVRLFAISKLGWIKRHQKNFSEQARQSEREYVSGESHYYAGERYLLNVIFNDTKPRVEIRNKTYIDLYAKPGSSRDQLQRIMNKWYRQHLREHVPAIIQKYEQVMNVQVADWGIKTMTTKWGTCNIQQKRIWLNLELAKKPTVCLEYIIVHEMVHLFERHHNNNFISYMDQYMPQWRYHKAELNLLLPAVV